MFFLSYWEWPSVNQCIRVSSFLVELRNLHCFFSWRKFSEINWYIWIIQKILVCFDVSFMSEVSHQTKNYIRKNRTLRHTTSYLLSQLQYLYFTNHFSLHTIVFGTLHFKLDLYKNTWVQEVGWIKFFVYRRPRQIPFPDLRSG